MYTTPEERRHSVPPPGRTDKMDISTLTSGNGLSSLTAADDLRIDLTYQPVTLPQTPPDSLSGSPKPKSEGLPFQLSSPIYNTASLNTSSTLPVSLPSIHEFVKGVHALARSGEPMCPRSPPSPLPSLSANSLLLHPMRPQHHGYTNYDNYQSSYPSEPPLHLSNGLDSYPSSASDAEDRHINQKYSTEEGDFIIYAWHDRKMKWVRIQKEFAERFGTTPKRSVQGLQAWYYRMNMRIPVWDADGWLRFDNEDSFEPRHVHIKCRERDGHGKNMEQLGLAQRYPERAIHYPWVDPELKLKARDWAAKRNLQYRERKERRRRKEQRRLKL